MTGIQIIGPFGKRDPVLLPGNLEQPFIVVPITVIDAYIGICMMDVAVADILLNFEITGSGYFDLIADGIFSDAL